MKKSKAVGRLIITLILMGCAIVFMFLYPRYSWAAVIFVALLVIWDFMYYKNFSRFKINRSGVEAESSANVQDWNTPKVPSLKSNQEASQAFMQINVALHSNSLGTIGLTYESPELLDEFIKQVKKAKENDYDLTNDENYQVVLKYFKNSILSNLGLSMQLRLKTDHKSIANFDVNDNITSTFNDGKVNFDALKAIQRQVEKADSDPNIPVSFSKAISDLKKLQ